MLKENRTKTEFVKPAIKQYQCDRLGLQEFSMHPDQEASIASFQVEAGTTDADESNAPGFEAGNKHLKVDDAVGVDDKDWDLEGWMTAMEVESSGLQGKLYDLQELNGKRIRLHNLNI